MTRPCQRRDFLKRTGALAAAAAVGPLAAAETAAPPIIDTHEHLWDLEKFKLPWLKGYKALARSYLPADYTRAAEGLNVVKTVYMEVDVAPDQQVAEAEYVLGLCRKPGSRMAGAVISGRPESDTFAAYLDRFKGDRHLKGVRRVLHVQETPAGHCLEKQFVANIRLLGERGLRFDLCMRPGELPDAAKLVAACPDTRFVLDHCGNADLKRHEQWKKDIALVARNMNVVGKVSGIIAQATPGKWTSDDLAPVIRHTLEVFGPDRVIFASDWPVCTLAATLKQWVAALRTIVRDCPEAEQRKLFHDNAAKFYELG
jgi:predicted TIM-barrel fold metal-dependent hydrolase